MVETNSIEIEPKTKSIGLVGGGNIFELARGDVGIGNSIMINDTLWLPSCKLNAFASFSYSFSQIIAPHTTTTVKIC